MKTQIIMGPMMKKKLLDLAKKWCDLASCAQKKCRLA
jgi:hypothetical protein